MYRRCSPSNLLNHPTRHITGPSLRFFPWSLLYVHPPSCSRTIFTMPSAHSECTTLENFRTRGTHLTSSSPGPSCHPLHLPYTFSYHSRLPGLTMPKNPPKLYPLGCLLPCTLLLPIIPSMPLCDDSGLYPDMIHVGY